jgi:PHD-finger
MSPRRSSRARTTQPPNLAGVPHTNSSSSSTSSQRADRSTRSHHKMASPEKPSQLRSRSSSSDGSARNAISEPPQTRRRRRASEEPEDSNIENPHEEGDRDGEEEEEEEDAEEVTRCLCGLAEYPGRPVPWDLPYMTSPKLDLPTFVIDPGDAGGLFIQCDICQVWQHGGCVGIRDESVPDKYYCEQCRKDKHDLGIAPNG